MLSLYFKNKFKNSNVLKSLGKTRLLQNLFILWTDSRMKEQRKSASSLDSVVYSVLSIKFFCFSLVMPHVLRYFPAGKTPSSSVI